MSDFYFTLHNGEIVGDGAIKDVAYLKRRIRAYCRKMTPLQRERLNALLAKYGRECGWWRSRNHYLVTAICSDAYLFAVAGDVEDLKEGA